MRIRLTLIVLPLLLGGWFDDPPAWARPDGRPILGAEQTRHMWRVALRARFPVDCEPEAFRQLAAKGPRNNCDVII